MPTGILGLDEILQGGLPRGRNTLIKGGAGCGKTVLALQILVNGARQFNEPGIFVAFEESSSQIIGNAPTLGWNLPALNNLFFLDARVSPDLLQSGDFDFSALLAIVEEKARELKVKRVVFDALDILLDLLDDPAAQRRELHRLYHFLLKSGLTGIITAKVEPSFSSGDAAHAVSMQFMSDCVIVLDHVLVDRISLRDLWVMKYRGSSFSESAVPMSITARGVELTASLHLPQHVTVDGKRVSSGVERLDIMLGGGYLSGSAVLITGAPGTSKSTLAAVFSEATCRRGDRAVYVSFEETEMELVRNFSSMGIDLKPHLDSGKLRMRCVLADACSATEHYMAIQRLLETHKPSCMVVDPLSRLIKGGGGGIAINIVERLIRLSKSLGITVINTAVLISTEESTPLQISAIADTWIHLSYLARAGERNRALTIVKSRGTHHSNQVRELLLSDSGVTLADTYTAGGEVLMGTLRWQKEQATLVEEELTAAENERKRLGIDIASAELTVRLGILKREIEMKKAEMDLVLKTEKRRKGTNLSHAKNLLERRGAGSNNEQK